MLYPQAGFTKAAVLDYYMRVAPVALPHLVGRPLTMKRYPDGVDSDPFFEKRIPSHAPDWIKTVRIESEKSEKTVDHVSVDDAATLAWVANMASLELHTSLARRPDVTSPTSVVFDLDPGQGADVLTCARVALLLKEVFDRLDLVSCVKTSGNKGLQVYVPVNAPTTYEATRGFSLAVGQLIERVHPDLALTNMSKQRRRGRVFIDWSQNHYTKTTVSVYSLRAQSRPTVSAPVSWDEVAEAIALGQPSVLSFVASVVLRRIEDLGDLFAPVEEVVQELPELG